MAKRKLKVTNLQKRFNKLIRSDMSYRGCVTCGTTQGKMDAGHFLAVGSHPSVRFDSHNVHKQCFRCNGPGSGEGAYYYEYMLRTYGLDEIEELKRNGRKPIKWSQTRLQRILDLIKDRERQVKERGIFDEILFEDYGGPEWD